MVGRPLARVNLSTAVYSYSRLIHARASFSADWGDYVSFAKHLRDKADAEGVDLLVVDTGDRVEGNAIYDSSKPRGKFTYEIAKEQHIDLISSGNHELYKADTAEGEYYHTVRDFQGSYLASNLDIYDPETLHFTFFRSICTKCSIVYEFAGRSTCRITTPYQGTYLLTDLKQTDGID